MSGTIDGTVQLPVGTLTTKLTELAKLVNESLGQYEIHAIRHVLSKDRSVTRVAIDSEGNVYKGGLVVDGNNVAIKINYQDGANPAALMQLKRILSQTLGYKE